jgi:hypothetical protein
MTQNFILAKIGKILKKSMQSKSSILKELTWKVWRKAGSRETTTCSIWSDLA